MNERYYRFMRLLVFFDLPMVTKREKKIYQKFRTFLLNDGYDMVQFSVYCRLCNGQDAVDKHLRRLQAQTPKNGSIRCLQITDKQYGNMKFFAGKQSTQEKTVSTSQILLF